MAPHILLRSRGSLTPLKVRSSFHRIRSCPDRRQLLRLLLWPFPWHLRLPPPLSVGELRSGDLETPTQHKSSIHQLRNIPLFRARDTPLRALYRLYEHICANDLIRMGYECEYFFFHPEARWRLSQIPDPHDPDSTRSAILASFVEALLDSFNWRLELGLRRDGSIDDSEYRATNFEPESPPAWAAAVAPLGQTLHLGKPQDQFNRRFLDRNIEAPMGYLYQV